MKSVFLCGQAAARQMVRQGGGGVIISMSSVNAVVVIPNQVAYSASKGGINQLTRTMAVALAPHKIRAVAIGPGTILTEMARTAVLKDDAARRKILSRTPIGRFGEAAEVAAVAAFLASDDASYITGQTIYPDGGRLVLNYTVPVAED
jgi:NAD(P)-dependent dehydrogenase (short-subunit alcohol dehydrogenase family)